MRVFNMKNWHHDKISQQVGGEEGRNLEAKNLCEAQYNSHQSI